MSTMATISATKIETKLSPSALSTLIDQSSDSSDPIRALTIQVVHNLQHQHLWTAILTHQIKYDTTDCPSYSFSSSTSCSHSTIPLISGIPPRRMYTHPDEQAYMLEIGLREDDLPLERMFILPTAQGQSWSLRKLAAVFDALPDLNDSSLPLNMDPLAVTTPASPGDKEPGAHNGDDGVYHDRLKLEKLAAYNERRWKANSMHKWGEKRLLLAMVDKGMGGDGTVVYYIVQDGIVKPRQN